MPEFKKDLEHSRRDFESLELVRHIGIFVMSHTDLVESYRKLIAMLSPEMKTFTALSSQALEVSAKIPESSVELRIEIAGGPSRRVGRKPLLPTEYESLITRKESGEPVFIGNVYTLTDDNRFEVINSLTNASVLVEENLKVELINHSTHPSFF